MFRIQNKKSSPALYRRPSRAKSALVRFWAHRRARNSALIAIALITGYFTWTHGELLPQDHSSETLAAQAASPLPPEWQERYFGKTVCKRDNYCGPDADPDKDTLSNYEEFLFFTDPTDPDTDKDGGQDGEEVRALSNPLGSGAGTAPRDINNIYEYNPFADQLADGGTEAIQNGEVITLDQIKESATRITDLPQFNEIPFKASDRNNQDGVNEYLARLVNATNTYRANAAVQGGAQILDTTDMQMLDQYIDATSLYATTLVFIEVPSELMQFHKALYGSLIFQAVSANNQKEFLNGALSETEARDRLRGYTLYYTRFVQLMHNYSQEIKQKYVFPFDFSSEQESE